MGPSPPTTAADPAQGVVPCAGISHATMGTRRVCAWNVHRPSASNCMHLAREIRKNPPPTAFVRRAMTLRPLSLMMLLFALAACGSGSNSKIDDADPPGWDAAFEQAE